MSRRKRRHSHLGRSDRDTEPGIRNDTERVRQHELLRQARTDWATQPALRADYMTHRPNVERAVAQVATTRGRRLKLRYRGTAKNNAWLKRRTATLNLRNLIGRGLARHNGVWVLAGT